MVTTGDISRSEKSGLHSGASTLCLCADSTSDSVAQEVLYECVQAIADFADCGNDIVALILTGSFSRGEGSILIDNQGPHKVLGDMEFFILTGTTMDLDGVGRKLAGLERQVEERLRQKNIVCDIDFSPVGRHYLKRMKPTIFNYELKTHGKVVYGDPDVMKETVSFHASDIPLFDAFYLLCNRIIEQLVFYRSDPCSRKGALVERFYPLIKMYMDMAGSFLIMKGKYKPDYATRCREFVGFEEKSFLGKDKMQAFNDRLLFFTGLKLQPDHDKLPKEQDAKDPYEIMRIFRETCLYADRLWKWEMKQLQEGASVATRDGDIAAILHCFGLLDVIKGWLKFIRIAHRQQVALSWGRIVTHFFMGPPRVLIYVAAAKLYFSLLDDNQVDLSDVQRYLPVDCDAQSVEETIDVTIKLWKTFVRSA